MPSEAPTAQQGPEPPAPRPSRFRGEDGSVRPLWGVLLFAALAGLAFLGEVLLALLLAGSALGPLRLGHPAPWLLVTARAGWVAGVTWLSCQAVGWRLGDAYLRDARWPRRLGQGAALGAAAFCLAVLGPLLAGEERFTLTAQRGGTVAAAFAWTALACASIAFSEELLVRGFALRQLERGLGRGPAVLATALAFGLLHVLNPYASWLGIANIALVGVWLGALVLRTGSLWVAVGLHFAWNLTQAFVWGEPVSGHPARASLLVRAPPGDALWTGGSFGTEASLSATAVLGALALAAALWPRRPAPAPDLTPR